MTQEASIGFFPALRILARMQALRFKNQVVSASFFRKNKEKRAATPGKSRTSWLFATFILISMAFSFANISYQSISRIEEQARLTFGAPVEVKAGRDRTVGATQRPAENSTRTVMKRVLPPALGFTEPETVLRALSFMAFLNLVAVILLSLGNGELIRQDWDLEWLVTHPIALPTLLSARIFTRALVNATCLFTLWPLFSIIAWKADYGSASPLLGLAAMAPLSLIAATVQTATDTGLRLKLGASQLRNLQAIISVVGVVVLFLVIAPSRGAFLLDFAFNAPRWTFWLPPGLAVQAITATEPQNAAAYFGLLLVEVALFLALGVAFLRVALSSGVVAAGVRESARRSRPPRKQGAAIKPGAIRNRILTPVQGRELLLLLRDRTFLVQTLVMPVVLIGSQILFNASGGSLFSSLGEHPEYLASIAFGIAAYSLMFSAFQTLNSEGQALWILYSVPMPLETVLRQKAALWGAVALLYPAILFAGYVGFEGTVPQKLLGLGILVLLGLPIFAVIASSLGVFACDPLSQTVQRRIKPSYGYLYLLLSSLFVYSFIVDNTWQRIALVILMALLAMALWQKARDHLPYLLDPAASPPARVSLSDGMIAAVLFFVLQAVVTAIRLFARGVPEGQLPSAYDVLIAFSIAGGVTFFVMRIAFWRLKSEGVPQTFGANSGVGVLLGIAGGLGAAVIGVSYLNILRHSRFFAPENTSASLAGHDFTLIAVLTILAAPLFEESIFRGLIFRGLRRSVNFPLAALASAAIFAIVHPPLSVLPVFGLGLIAAFVYERSRLLIAPMTAHAVYNAVIVGYWALERGV